VPAALPLAPVPDKRQQSKQRRAARNRARREALAARREAARREAAAARAEAASRSSGGSNPGTSGAGPIGPAPTGLAGYLNNPNPGHRAILVSVALAIVAAIYLLFYRVPVDDRGEPWPAAFQAVAKMARERLTGAAAGDETTSLLDASGPALLAVLALPIFVTLFSVWASTRTERARLLTFAMLAMAAAVILTGGIGIFFFPALIALAVGGFRARRADLPARMAERATRARRGRDGDVIDVDSEEVDAGEDVQDAVEDDDDIEDVPEDDPLAELEAELAAEEAADGEDEDGEGRRKRR
jgi:hypothetical protein